MANTIVQSMALRISYDYGMDDNNKQVVKTASYSKIDRQASAADLPWKISICGFCTGFGDRV